MKQTELNQLGQDIFELIQKHGITAEKCGISIAVTSREYDRIKDNFDGKGEHLDITLVVMSEQKNWTLQITRQSLNLIKNDN